MGEEKRAVVTILPISTRKRTRVSARDRSIIATHPEHARRLGVITGEWNAIEHFWVLMLARALRTQPKTVYAIAYQIISNRHRIKAMYAGTRRIIRSSQNKDALKALFSRTLEALDTRNGYVHALYMDDLDAEKSKPTKSVWRIELNHDTPVDSLVTQQDMDAFIDQLALLKRDLFDFVESEPWTVRRQAPRESDPQTPPETTPSRNPTSP